MLHGPQGAVGADAYLFELFLECVGYFDGVGSFGVLRFCDCLAEYGGGVVWRRWGDEVGVVELVGWVVYYDWADRWGVFGEKDWAFEVAVCDRYHIGSYLLW